MLRSYLETKFLITYNRQEQQWRNVAPVARGRHEKGAPKFRIQVIWLQNVPYVGLINVRWWGNIWVYKKLQEDPKTYQKN